MFTYEWDFAVVFKHSAILAEGLAGSLLITGISLLFGFITGLFAALARLSSAKLLNIPAKVFIETFRTIPALAQLFWVFYGLPIVMNVRIEPLDAVLIVLSLASGAFFAEIIRAGIRTIDQGQWDAGRALGMNAMMLMGWVILPQAFRRMIPALTNQAVDLFKATPIAAVIAYPDLLYQGMRLSQTLYRPLEVYTVIAAFYFIILFAGSRLAGYLESRLT